MRWQERFPISPIDWQVDPMAVLESKRRNAAMLLEASVENFILAPKEKG